MQSSTSEPRTEGVSKEVFERECKVMELFIKNAETYTKLSAGALFLTVTFLRQIAGVPENTQLPRSPLLIFSWICFLVAILAGALYQYFAVKFLEWKSGVPRTHKTLFEYLVHHPSPPYGVMLGAFYFGGTLFTVFAVQRILCTP